jgi:hypothetical protein
MRFLILTISLLFSTAGFSQDVDTGYVIFSNQNTTADINPGDNYLMYTVGSYNLSGYGVETRWCPIDSSIRLSNGRRVAGLNYILDAKYDYIGGQLIFGVRSTRIVDVLFAEVGDGARFTVKGEDFEMGFTLLNEGSMVYQKRVIFLLGF